jgi:hypothetical protein
MLITETLRSFGIIYAELLETYNVGAGYTAIILSIVKMSDVNNFAQCAVCLSIYSFS